MGKRVTHQNRQTEHVKEGQDRSGGIAGPHRWKHHDDSIRTPFKPFEDAFPNGTVSQADRRQFAFKDHRCTPAKMAIQSRTPR